MKVEQYPFVEAVRFFWRRRQGQAAEQAARGTFDQGTRSAVTGGGHMNGFLMTLVEHLNAAGVSPEHIFTKRTKTYLPGFFRSSKQWDLVVYRAKQVIAVVELKSQVGSFGNNLNNRTEEALGNAEDFWTAYRDGLLGDSDPFLGFLYLIESHPKSLSPVRLHQPHLPVLEEFRDTSYRDRLGILCRKLVLERKYSSASGIEASRSRIDDDPNYEDIDLSHSSRSFIERLVKRVSETY